MNAAAAFTLIATSQLDLTASLAAILNSTTPLIAAVVVAGWMGEASTARKMVGLVMGIVGGETPSLSVVLSVLGLALLSTAAAYLLYFRLIANVGPTQTLSVTSFVPIFGVLFGVLLLNEPVGVGTSVGMGTILSSVVLVRRLVWKRARGGEESIMKTRCKRALRSIEGPGKLPAGGWCRVVALWGFTPVPFFRLSMIGMVSGGRGASACSGRGRSFCPTLRRRRSRPTPASRDRRG